jgi:tetratricopeptide (TPR) repeat protein
MTLMEQTRDSDPLGRPVGRRVMFRLLAALLPVLGMPLVGELGLRLSRGVESRGFLEQRGAHHADNYRFSRRYFPASLARAQQPLLVRRERGRERRIVVLGESAAMGDPEPAVGLPRMLEAMLSLRYPAEEFVVINAAMTAINSWAVADIAEDLAVLGADAAVVYVGNNEVVGPFGAGTVFGSQAPPGWWVRAQLSAGRTALGQWLQARSDSQTGGRSWQGMEMFLQHEVTADDPALDRVRAAFAANVRRIARTLASGERPVVISAAAVNLRDCPPFSGDAARQAWQGAKSSDGPASLDALRKARELDTLRFRCDGRMQALLPAALAGLRGVTLLDLQAELDAEDNGAAGATFFHEHVHLTPRGTWEVARRCADALAPSLGLKPEGSWPGLDDCLVRLGFTPWHGLRLLEEMRDRFRRAPFTLQEGHAARMAELESRIAQARAGATPDAMKAWGEAAIAVSDAYENDWRNAVQAALLLEAAGDDRAVSLMARAALAMPHQVVLQLQGSTLNRFRRYADAEAVLRKAIALRPDFPGAWHSLGISLSHLGRLDEAVDAFGHALGQSPDYLEARRALASVQLKRRHPAAAAAALRDLLQRAPDDVAAHDQLGRLLTADGRFTEALPHYEAVARLLPRDAAAQVNAGALHFRLGNREAALPLLRRALEIEPGHAAAAEVLRQMNPNP